MNRLVIGCLVLGFLLGENGLGLINYYTIEQLKPFASSSGKIWRSACSGRYPRAFSLLRWGSSWQLF